MTLSEKLAEIKYNNSESDAGDFVWLNDDIPKLLAVIEKLIEQRDSYIAGYYTKYEIDICNVELLALLNGDK